MKKYLALSVLILLFLHVDLAFSNSDSPTATNGVYVITKVNASSASCHGTDMAITGGASCPYIDDQSIYQLYYSEPAFTGATKYATGWQAMCVWDCNDTKHCAERKPATITVVCVTPPID